MKRKWYNLMQAIALVGALATSASYADGVKVGEVGGWNVNVSVKIEDLKAFFNDCGKFASDAWKKMFTRHREFQQVFTINGKNVVAVPVRSDAGGLA